MVLGITITAFIAVLAAALFFFQRRLIYFPRHYGPEYTALMPQCERLEFTTSSGKQVTFYLPPKDKSLTTPEKLWVLFPGNASLGLDWLDLLNEICDERAGYLLIDYPGYGASEGAPTMPAIGETSDAALVALATHLKTEPAVLEKDLNVLGLSIGTATGLQFAVRHPVRRVVLLAPFTTMLAMARRSVGWPLNLLLQDRFDNRARLDELAARSPRPEVHIIHGTSDSLVPFAMGKELAERHPDMVKLHAIAGATHELLYSGNDDAYRELIRTLAPICTAKREPQT